MNYCLDGPAEKRVGMIDSTSGKSLLSPHGRNVMHRFAERLVNQDLACYSNIISTRSFLLKNTILKERNKFLLYFSIHHRRASVTVNGLQCDALGSDSKIS